MSTSEDLRDPAACRVAPQHDVAKIHLRDEALDVAHVVLDEVAAFRVPAGIAVAAHVYGEHVKTLGEVRREMVERLRHAPDAMQQDHRLCIRIAPFEHMDAKAIDGDEALHRLS